jgi:hypothetical protein
LLYSFAGPLWKKRSLVLASVGESCLDYVEQVPGIERFKQEMNGAFRESSLSSFRAIVGSYKDNWQLRTLDPDAAL